MGIEIRRVPADWRHPAGTIRGTNSSGEITSLRTGLIPLFEPEFHAERVKDWAEELMEWIDKTHDEYDPDIDFWDYEEPPSREDCADYKGKAATWYQVYETVSMGTPVTPAFETQEELIEHLCTNGTSWDDEPWDRDSTERFAKLDKARPTAVVEGGVMKTPREQ